MGVVIDFYKAKDELKAETVTFSPRKPEDILRENLKDHPTLEMVKEGGRIIIRKRQRPEVS